MSKLFHVLILLYFVTIPWFSSAQTNGIDKKQILNWEVGNSPKINEIPEKWYLAKVPGAVQLDFAKALKYGAYFYAENWKDYLWMEDVCFTYRTSFAKPSIANNEKCYFISKGIDYEFEIWLNGEKLFYQEGMFTPFKLDLTTLLKDKNELLVKIYPIPKLHKEPADRSQASQSVKPALSYGWDWHPRLVPVGIWDDTFLEIVPNSEISNFDWDYTLNDNLTTAHFSAKLKGANLEKCHLSLKIADKTGNPVLNKNISFSLGEANIDAEINNIQLWWPHDHGKPYLYDLEFLLLNESNAVVQKKTAKIGFRKIQLVMNDGAWVESGLPTTRNVSPIQIEINNRKIFAKGTNWLNPEIFPGAITRDRYNELIDRAVEANFNIFRVWGGGIINKDAFYELCNEKGILVWQEFPLACNNYEGTPHYLKILTQESESIIKRLKNYASLAIWCGGNELFNNWSRMTDQSAALRLLNSQCYLLDPKTPFLQTSPLMGINHGHYVFRDMKNNEEVFQWMPRAHATAYCEFGVPALSSVEVLKTIIPTNELWPPKPGTSWESHHAFKAWTTNTWLMPDVLLYYFGEAKNLETMVANSQLLQAEGYKCIYEEGRRQKPYCSMVMNWCFNEPWPTAANNSIVSYLNIPKPAFYAVKNACRPFLASARLNKFQYLEAEEFTADIWILNDLPNETQAGKVKVKIVAGNSESVLLNWDFQTLKANTNLAGPTIRLKLPHWEVDRFKLVLEVEGHPEFNSEYTLLFKK